MLVLDYYIDQNWAFHEVQLTVDEVDCVFFSILEIKLWMIYIPGQHTGAGLAEHLAVVLDRLELTHSRLLGITTDIESWNYSITHELQSTIEASGIEWPPSR